MKHQRPPVLLLAILLAATGCNYQAHRILTFASTPNVTEGQRAQVTVTIHNIHSHPIVPVAMTLYARPDPTEYFVVRQVVGEAEYYTPLQATEVRHLQTLDRIEADHVRDGNIWRHVPDTRFLHPRILLPGQSLAETFQFQTYAPYRRLLYCDFYYLTLAGEQARGRLFLRAKPQTIPPDAQRYTEVFTRIDETKLNDPNPQPDNYLLFRPRRPTDSPPRLITLRVPLDVHPRRFSYEDAARRARFGARAHCYFAAAGVWVFEYPDDGTWLIGPVATTKLQGHYANAIADLELRQATTLTLTAPRTPDDKLLQLFRTLGYADPKDTAPTATANIPAESLLTVLEHAETLGYLIEPPTWHLAQ